MRVLSPTQVEIDRQDLCAIAAAATQGVSLDHILGALTLPGLQETARAALSAAPEVLQAYRVGESAWKASLERSMTERIHDPKQGSVASNGLLLFALRSRCGYKMAGSEEVANAAPVILVAGNKLARVKAAKEAAERGALDTDAPAVVVRAERGDTIVEDDKQPFPWE